MNICRICSVEHKIPRRKVAPGIGGCPICKERHALYPAKHTEVARIAGMNPSASVFNRFCTGFGITDEREAFHKFARQCHIGGWTWDVLIEVYEDFLTWGQQAMIAAQDAQDLADTQADALK